jgi:predicted nucleotidyltransferase
VLPRLKKLFEKLENVEMAILFGSIVRDKISFHDVDVALKLKKEDLSLRNRIYYYLDCEDSTY